MYQFITFFARVSYKLGSKDPVESAVTIITVVQVSLCGLLLGLLHRGTNYHISKTTFLIVTGVITFFNLWYLNDKAHTVIGERYREKVNMGHVVLGIVMYFSLTLGLLSLVVPLSKWLF